MDITPPVGEFGSFRLAPNKRSLGVHDPLNIHVLYLDNRKQALLLVSVDCVALPAVPVAKIKQAVRRVADLDESQILVAATHTHNGAETLGEEPVANYKAQINRIVEGVVSAAEEALRNVVPTRTGWGSVQAPGIAKNRFEARLENGNIDKVDNQIDFLKVEDAEGNYQGVLWHFAAHPTTCMRAGYMNSADYYGVVNRILVKQLGGFAIFFNGACGNINLELGAERTFEKAEDCGRTIAGHLVEAIPTVETQDRMELVSNSVEIDIPLTEKRKDLILPDDREEIMAYFEKIETLDLTPEDYDTYWPDFQRLRVSWWRHRLMEEFDGIESESVTLQGHRIGDRLILTVPGEIFIEFQFDLQKAFGDTRAMVFGYANGYIGYVSTAESFGIPAYETEPTFAQRAGQYAGRAIIDEGINLLRNL